MNTENELAEAFEANYMESMSAAPETTDGPRHIVEKIDAYLSMGWESSAIEHIEELESKYGVDFEELVEDTVSAHIKDPRGEN